MFTEGQEWHDTAWGHVKIVKVIPLDEERISVSYSVNNQGWPVAAIKYIDCERCMRFPIDVRHDNCRHKGMPGHSKSHCTASTCF